MKYILLSLLTLISVTVAQVTNLQQKVVNGRVVVTFNYKDITKYIPAIAAKNSTGLIITPSAYSFTATGRNQGIIWWEPQLEGLPVAGWTVQIVSMEFNWKKYGNISWVLIEGGPVGKAYFLSATEVTFEQYDIFCNETGYRKPDDNWGRGKLPVINVNVEDALAYCRWLSSKSGYNIRLPEENEWEYAAKGGKYSKGYNYAGSNNLDEVGWYDGNSGSTQLVGTKKPNELGLYDMSGNVWEWTGNQGVLRGGSLLDDGEGCSVSHRNSGYPDYRLFNIGFRLFRN